MWWIAIGCIGGKQPLAAPTAPAPSERPLNTQARMFYLRGVAAATRHDPAEATRWANWVVRIDRQPQALVAAAGLLLEVGAFARAAELAAEATVASPDLASAHRIVGLSRLQLGDPEGALPALERAGDLPGVTAALIRAEIARSRRDLAAERLAAWVPASPARQLERARATLDVGPFEDAQRLALALAADPVLGPSALGVAVEAGRPDCVLAPVWRWVEAHPSTAAGGDWAVPLAALRAAADGCAGLGDP